MSLGYYSKTESTGLTHLHRLHARAAAKGELVSLRTYLQYRFARPKRHRSAHDKWLASREFLDSYEWATIRYKALKRYGGTCKACGIQAGMKSDDGRPAVIHVDHVKPRKKYPQLALNLSNMQPLCHLCNKGKGNWDRTDWR